MKEEKKRTRPPTRHKHNLSVERLTELIPKYDGNLAAVGRACNCSRQAVHDFVNKHPELQTLTSDVAETTVDEAENQLLKAVKAGKPWAIALVLTTRGRKRGYIKEAEVNLKQTNPPRTVIYLPENGRNAVVDAIESGDVNLIAGVMDGIIENESDASAAPAGGVGSKGDGGKNG
jgi:hypothetical protein